MTNSKITKTEFKSFWASNTHLFKYKAMMEQKTKIFNFGFTALNFVLILASIAAYYKYGSDAIISGGVLGVCIVLEIAGVQYLKKTLNKSREQKKSIVYKDLKTQMLTQNILEFLFENEPEYKSYLEGFIEKMKTDTLENYDMEIFLELNEKILNKNG